MIKPIQRKAGCNSRQLQIGNWQSAIENESDDCPAPATKLGAKWVEVTKTAGTTFLTTYERIENVASNTR
jgi:hypothetical protein